MITLSKDVERALAYAVHAKPNLEVGGFAKVQQTDKGLLLTDILIPPQLVGSASVHMAEEIPELGMTGFEWIMIELAKRNETLSNWNCWWHSHSTMDPFASHTDKETLANFAEMVESRWAIGLVTNTKREYHCWMDDARPPWRTTQDKIEVQIEALDKVQPLFDNVMKMMKAVKSAPVSPTSAFAGIRDLRHPNNPIAVVWCSEHMDFSDKCPIKHIPPSNLLCKHQPNCGEGGCFSKAERKKMNQARKGRQAGTRNYRGAEVLLGIDEDDYDAQFDAAFEEAGRYA